MSEMSNALAELGEMIALAQEDAVISHAVEHDELTIVAVAGGLRTLITHLKENAACAFTTMIDITAVDWPEREDRFEVVYHFLSMQLGTISSSATGTEMRMRWFWRMERR